MAGDSFYTSEASYRRRQKEFREQQDSRENLDGSVILDGEFVPVNVSAAGDVEFLEHKPSPGKTVIFGGSGFVGSALCSLLEKRGIKYVAPALQEIDLVFGESQQKIKELVQDGDTIIMIAALTAEHGIPYQLTEMNICMAANILRGIENKDIAHCVYLSSDSVYGEEKRDKIDELTIIQPTSLYGHMHAIREKFFAERFAANQLTILRPCAIYGPGDTHNTYGINQFVSEAKKHRTITLFGDGEECRSSVYIDDVAEIVSYAALYKISGGFNVNCGYGYTFKQMAEMVRDNMEMPVEILSKPRTVSVVHRLMDNAKLLDVFLVPRTPDIGIKDYLACLSN